MTDENQPREEEITQQKEDVRQFALNNLKESAIVDLATAYFVEESGQYGEAGNYAVEKFKYFPAINSGFKAYDLESGKEFDVIQNSLLSSRNGGKRYSGNVSEYDIINTCAKIIEGSLGKVNVQNALKLIGSDKQVKESYKDKYLGDLAESENQEDKKIFEAIQGMYLRYLTDSKVSEALAENAKTTQGGLEGILTEPEENSQ